MNAKQIYAILALHAYAGDKVNRPRIPDMWTEIPQPEGTSGFAYSVYRNESTNEIVISFRGTEPGLTGDWLTNLGLSLSQETQAAAVYARVLKDFGAAANITFTGHSLGGGLAGTMAVWFNRTAVVFDPAPSQITATFGPNVSYIISTLGADAPQSIKVKGQVTMLFITHHIPRGLQVDEVLSFGPGQQATRMEVVGNEQDDEDVTVLRSEA